MKAIILAAGVFGLAAASQANIFSDYEDLTEGFFGPTWTHNGVTYRDVNNVSGAYADGTPFDNDDNGSHLALENAAFFYNDFPTYGSFKNALTFGDFFVNGDNLSLGALASVYMDIDQPATAASFDIAYYENGPWGGITYHLDALNGSTVVASTSFDITSVDPSGRDNAAFTTMSLTSGTTFTSLHLYAMKDGNYTAPRGMIDNLSISTVPEPATLAALGFGAAAMLRRKRKK